jgi:coproporphyrinogen III oxidase-like Fe-S oxidoreductase
MQQDSYGLYIHWPFCAKKCPYCDYNSHVRQAVDQDAFLNAYLKELLYYQSLLQDIVLHPLPCRFQL